MLGIDKLRMIAANIDISGQGLPRPGTDSDDLQSIFNIVFAVMAAIAVLIIVIAGIKFIWSRGDPQATVKARNAIIYAALGLVVIAIAFAIVALVLNVLG